MTNLKQFVKALEAMGIRKDSGKPHYTVTNLDAKANVIWKKGDGVVEEIAITVWDKADEDDVRYADYWFRGDGTFWYLDVRSAKEDGEAMPPDGDDAETSASERV